MNSAGFIFWTIVIVFIASALSAQWIFRRKKKRARIKRLAEIKNRLVEDTIEQVEVVAEEEPVSLEDTQEQARAEALVQGVEEILEDTIEQEQICVEEEGERGKDDCLP